MSIIMLAGLAVLIGAIVALVYCSVFSDKVPWSMAGAVSFVVGTVLLLITACIITGYL